MAVFVAVLVVLLAMTGYSNAAYCMCKDGMGDNALQKNIDYSCGQGADCIAIKENGSCYNPNTVKDHCNYAVNSYYQKKNQIGGSCDFSGTAILSPTPPPNSVSGCAYPSSAGSVTPTTPSVAPPGSTTPGTVTPTNPGTAPPGGTSPPGTITPPGNPSIIAPPGSTNPITTTPGSGGTTTQPAFGGLGPTAGGFNPDGTIGSGGVHDHQGGGPGLFASLALTVVVSSWIWFRV